MVKASGLSRTGFFAEQFAEKEIIRSMLLRILTLIGVIFAAEAALAQGIPHQNIALGNNAGTTVILSQQPVYVCTSAGSGSPCAPQANIYSDSGLTHLITQPLMTDSNGNFQFWVSPGQTYYINPVPSGFSAYFYYWTAPPLLGANNAFTGQLTQTTNPGLFTDAQTDDNVQVTVGSIPCNNWYHGTGGAPPGYTGFATEGICSAMAIPSTSTKLQTNSVAGYAENLSTATFPVAGFFTGTGAANGSRTWGINELCNITSGGTGYGCLGNELDYNNNTGIDDTASTPPFIRQGMAIISGGSNKVWYGLSLQATNPSTNNWKYGLGILDYDTLGLQVGGPTGSLLAGARGELIYASDASNSTAALQLVDPTATITRFQVTDAGSVSSTNLVSIGAQSISGCSLTNALGGSWAGSFKSGTTGPCTVTITPGITAPNGFVCDAHDLTTVADAINQTAYSTTTATINGTTASSDLITWKCAAF